MLFYTTPFNRVIAVDPATGRGVWSYDPKIDQTLDYGDGLVQPRRRDVAISLSEHGKTMSAPHI